MTTYIFKLISLLGGLALFLFGMDVMGTRLWSGRPAVGFRPSSRR